MSKCGLNWAARPYVKPGSKIRISPNTYLNINKEVTCQSFNVIYLIECNKETVGSIMLERQEQYLNLGQMNLGGI